MYEHVDLCVKVGHSLSDFFPSYTGVKQGCPLSPNLFGLYIDAFEKYLEQFAPCTGPLLPGGLTVPCLIYADDIVLLANSAENLQAQIDALHRFCKDWRMTVNMDKTKVVVFRPANCVTRYSWNLGGRPVQIAEEYKYLGLYFHATKTMQYTRFKLSMQANTAMMSLFARAAEMDLRRNQPQLYLKLFQALVQPVISYACSVWATDLKSQCDIVSNPLEQVHTAFLRRFWGLRQYVSPWILYSEHDRQPLVTSWWKQTLKLWNKIVTAGSPIVRGVLAQNVADFRLGCNFNWTSGVVHFVQVIRPGFCLGNTVPFDVTQHHKLYLSHIWSVARDMAADPSRVRLHTYFQCFKPPKGHTFFTDIPSHLRFPDLVRLVRFRTGCHDLHVERGRWNHTPRDARTCSLCGQGIQDEYHIIFACSALVDVRLRFPELFRHHTMRAFFFTYNKVGPLAAFVGECLHRAGVPHRP
jgi:hypothetical protein